MVRTLALLRVGDTVRPIKRLALGAAVLSFVFVVSVRAEDKTFVNISGAPGESTDGAHPNWIDAYALDYSVDSPSGAAPNFKDVSFLKGTDKSTPILNNAAGLGTNLGLVTIDVCRNTSPQQCYLKVELSNAFLENISLSGSSCVGTGACTPSQTESISLRYTRIKLYYTPWTGGSPGTQVIRCYDLTTRTAC